MQINNITDVTNGTSVLKLSFNVDRTMDNVKAQVTYVGYSASVGDLSYTEKGDGTYDCETSITLKSIPQKARVYFNGTTNAKVKGIFKNFNITIDDVAVDFTIVTQDYFTCSKQENFKLTTNKDFTDKVTEINSTIRYKRNVVSKNQLKNLELAYSLDFSDVRNSEYVSLWPSWLNSGVLELPGGKHISDSRSPSLDTFKLLLKFKVADTNTIVQFNGGGQKLTVDFTDNKLKVISSDVTVNEVAVDFMTIETIYTLNLVKNATSLSMTLCDKTTGKSYTIETTTNYMTGFGNITTTASGGTVYISEYKLYLPFIRTNPAWLFGGDSITQGVGVTDISNRWCSRILEKYCDGDGIIWGKGYDKSSGMLTRLQAIYDLGYKPKNVVIMIGTNDTLDSTSGYDLWVSNIDSMIELITTNGGNPIFCVPPMKHTEEANNIIFQMRDYLLSKPYKVIRMDLATSVDGVGVTQDTSLFNSDKLHPNDAGTLKMYERFLLDIGDGIIVDDKKEELSTVVPVGTVSVFAGSTAPEGYLICDGSAVSRTTYSSLFEIVNTTYGEGDGSTTFNLPNLQGKLTGNNGTITMNYIIKY